MATVESEDSSSPKEQLNGRIAAILENLQKNQQKANVSKSSSRPILTQKITVAVMGATGAGKSRFIKRVTEDDAVVVGEGLQSETQHVRAFERCHQDRQYVLVDTPGFNDTDRPDQEILQELADWLAQSYRDGLMLSGVIYLHRISAPRMEGSSMRNLRMFRKLCGEDFLHNVVIGTTFWGTVDEEIGAAREKGLLESGKFFGELKERGCKIVRIPQEVEGCLAILENFANKRPSIMRIQQELLEGKSIDRTEASSEIGKELAELQRQNVEKFQAAKKTMQNVVLKSSLEKALAMHLERKEHDEEIAKADVHEEGVRDEIREQMEQQRVEDEERLERLKKSRRENQQGYQIQLDMLQSKLAGLKAKVEEVS